MLPSWLLWSCQKEKQKQVGYTGGEGKYAYLVELGKEIFIENIISNIAIFFSTTLQSTFLPVQFLYSTIQAYMYMCVFKQCCP